MAQQQQLWYGNFSSSATYCWVIRWELRAKAFPSRIQSELSVSFGRLNVCINVDGNYSILPQSILLVLVLDVNNICTCYTPKHRRETFSGISSVWMCWYNQFTKVSPLNKLSIWQKMLFFAHCACILTRNTHFILFHIHWRK